MSFKNTAVLLSLCVEGRLSSRVFFFNYPTGCLFRVDVGFGPKGGSGTEVRAALGTLSNWTARSEGKLS